MTEYFRKIPHKQDMPPPGGYPKLNYAQQLPKRGPPGLAIMAGGVAVMAFGFYFVSKGNQERRELGREKRIAQLSLLPVLQAEQDRWILRRLKENLETEKLIMKDVPGWDAGKSVYYTDRWVKPKPYQLEKL